MLQHVSWSCMSSIHFLNFLFILCLKAWLRLGHVAWQFARYLYFMFLFKLFSCNYLISDYNCFDIKIPKSKANLKPRQALPAFCSTFSPVINSESLGPCWMKGHTGQGESRPQHQPYVSASAPHHPLWPPVAPQTCREDGKTWRPIVNPGDGQGVRAGEKQGGKGGGEQSLLMRGKQSVLLLYAQQ